MIPAHRPHSRRRKPTTAAVSVAAMLVTSTGPLSSPAAAATTSASTHTAPRRAATAPDGTTGKPTVHTVTLITGDVVTVTSVGGGHSNVDVQRPHGATGGVRTETIGKDLYVLPDEALPYLAADELDRRLFDVTSLISEGYDDQHSSAIPMILSYAGRPSVGRSAQVDPRGRHPDPHAAQHQRHGGHGRRSSNARRRGRR